jgi:hypothetical protein
MTVPAEHAGHYEHPLLVSLWCFSRWIWVRGGVVRVGIRQFGWHVRNLGISVLFGKMEFGGTVMVRTVKALD